MRRLHHRPIRSIDLLPSRDGRLQECRPLCNCPYMPFRRPYTSSAFVDYLAKASLPFVRVQITLHRNMSKHARSSSQDDGLKQYVSLKTVALKPPQPASCSLTRSIQPINQARQRDRRTPSHGRARDTPEEAVPLPRDAKCITLVQVQRLAHGG